MAEFNNRYFSENSKNYADGYSYDKYQHKEPLMLICKLIPVQHYAMQAVIVCVRFNNNSVFRVLL